MVLLTVENIAKNYGDKTLFSNITFGIDEEDKLGLIGINGTGKSTLLKIIAGLETPDEGKIIMGSKVKIHYLSQNPSFDEDSSVLHQVFNSHDPRMQALYNYQQVLEEVNKTASEKALAKLTELNVKMDQLKAWELEAEAKNILTKLGITEFNTPVKHLSGGQRKRVALARALITPCDLLILDEPTNHVDNETLDWLEDFLKKRKGALLLITHDRYFLDRVVNQIIELDKGKLYSYKGNYTYFLEVKAEREEQEASMAAKHKGLLRKELAWMRKGAKARTTKQKARIGRFEELQEKSVDTSKEELEVKIGAKRLGKKVLELKDINKAYDNRTLIKDLDYIVQPRERLGIIGPNGSGKSTLLNILVGKISPNKGEIEIGPTVKIGYYDQESTALKEDQRVIDYIKEVGEVIRTSDGQVITASQMLERFLFPGTLQWSYIGKLSGGERRRLYLLRVLMAEPNVLFLDEPTNDLDIQTLTILEDYLDNFPGAVIIVSHDRYFLDRTIDKLFVFEGGGQILQYTGNYSEYQETKKERIAMCSDREEDNSKKVVEKANPNESKEKVKTKFTYKEQQEFDQIEDLIAELEEKIALTKEKMATSTSNYLLLQELAEEEKALEEKLNYTLDRWAELTEMAEEFARLKKK